MVRARNFSLTHLLIFQVTLGFEVCFRIRISRHSSSWVNTSAITHCIVSNMKLAFQKLRSSAELNFAWRNQFFQPTIGKCFTLESEVWAGFVCLFMCNFKAICMPCLISTRQKRARIHLHNSKTDSCGRLKNNLAVDRCLFHATPLCFPVVCRQFRSRHDFCGPFKAHTFLCSALHPAELGPSCCSFESYTRHSCTQDAFTGSSTQNSRNAGIKVPRSTLVSPSPWVCPFWFKL